jgi:hypothetical protein
MPAMRKPVAPRAGRIAALVAALVLSGPVLTGCGGNDPVSSASDAPSADQALPPAADVEDYFAAVASYDPDQLRSAVDVTEPGSVAATYAGYLTELSQAATDGGDPVPGAEITATADGYKACGGTGGPQDCVEWADFEGYGGKLVDFTINGTSLDDRLVAGDGTSQNAGGLATVTMDYAYQSIQSDDLFVVVSVDATEDVTIRSDSATYQQANGAPVGPDRYVGRTGTPAGSTATVVLVFSQVPVGGTVDLTLVSADQHSETVQLATG